MALDAEQIAAWYRQYTGREPDAAGLAAHQANPYGLANVEAVIRDSDEAKRYAASRSMADLAKPPATTAPSTTSYTPGTPGPAYSADPSGAYTRQADTKRVGWGFNSPTGGRATFDYTDADFGTDYGNFSGFGDYASNDQNDSLKGIAKRFAAGLASGPNGFDEAALDEFVKRLNAAGIPAKKVDAYQVDFGLGEGPMQVRSSQNQFWWNNRATEHLPASGPASMADFLKGPSTTPTTTTPTPEVTTPTPEPVTAAAATTPTSAAPQTDVTPEADTFAATLMQQGYDVVEVMADQVRVVTQEDRERGNLYGTWLTVSRKPRSMADLAA